MTTSTTTIMQVGYTTIIGYTTIKRCVFTLMISLAMSIVIAPAGIGNAYAAGDVKEGSVKARACQICHGKDGKSTKEIYPILAGQHAAYLRKQLQAFRAGTRKDPIMNSMAAELSDQDIDDIASFFSGVP